MKRKRNRRQIPVTGDRGSAQARHTRGVGRQYSARALDGALDLVVYDEIGYWGVTADQVRRELDAFHGERINLDLNSPGGDVFDGIAIYNDLARHDAAVHVTVTGLAASIASVIAMAGDEVEIGASAFFMVHNAWTFVAGNKERLRGQADVLEQIDGAIALTYHDRTDRPIDELRALMDSESWIGGEDAVEMGLADRITDTADEDTVAARFDLSVFQNRPEAVACLDDSEALPANRRDAERWLMRDAGLSRSEARAFMNACGTAPVTPGADELVRSIEATAAAYRGNT